MGTYPAMFTLVSSIHANRIVLLAIVEGSIVVTFILLVNKVGHGKLPLQACTYVC